MLPASPVVSFRSMGSGMTACVDAPAARAEAMLERVPRWFAAWDKHLSRFRTDSELVRLNRLRSTRVSATLAGALGAALAAARWTEGLVTPTILDALEHAGYINTFELVANGITAKTELIGPCVDRHTLVTLDPVSRTVRKPENVRLDLGGTAKGWCADRAAAILALKAPSLVDAGGDIAISGPRADGSAWRVGIESAVVDGEVIATLALHAGGVATSGRNRRKWLRNGAWQHHAIDARSGKPAETDVLSATVVAASALQAEVAAKVVLIRGMHDGLAWIESQGLAALAVNDDGEVVATRSLEEFLVA